MHFEVKMCSCSRGCSQLGELRVLVATLWAWTGGRHVDMLDKLEFVVAYQFNLNFTEAARWTTIALFELQQRHWWTTWVRSKVRNKFKFANLHESNRVPDLQFPAHCVIPRMALRFLQLPWGGTCVLISPIVTLSARLSGRQFCCDKGSILHFLQHPSM